MRRTDRTTRWARWALLAGVAALAWGPKPAQAFPSKTTSCVSCHNAPSPVATVTAAIDGTVTNTATVAPGQTFEVDFVFTNMLYTTKYAGTGPEIAVPAGWTVAAGTTNSPAIGGWNTVWDAASGVGWNNPMAVGTEHPNSPDGYAVNYANSSWDSGSRDAAFDDGSAGDLDGVANMMGADALITVPPATPGGTYEIVVLGIGHDDANTKGYIAETLTITVQSGPSYTTTLGDGTNPGNASLAPGGAATMADAFSLATDGTSDTCTAATVNLGAGAAPGVALVEITDAAGGTVYGSAANPASDTVSVTGLSLPVGAAATQFRVRITPKTHAAMPAAPGATYTVTPRVTALTCGHATAGSDSASATITIDNQSPGDVTGFSGAPDNALVALTWANPGDADYAETIVVRSTSTISAAPAEGSAYTTASTIGGLPVVYVGTGTSYTDTGLANGTGYYFKAFTRDANGNWSAGSQTGPHTPQAATTAVGNGTDPGSVTIAPGAAVTDLDAFTVSSSAGDTITALTVTLAAGTWQGLQTVAITNASNTVLGSATPSGDAVAITLSTPITVTGSAVGYKVRVTPKTHAAMPAVPGGSYAVTGTVTAITCTNPPSHGDSASATVTVDNLSPSNVTWGGVNPGDGQVALAWSNPGGDFAQVVIVRSTSTISVTPTEGQSYTAGNTIGGLTVVYAGTGTSHTDTGVSNGTAYYYKAFAKDGSGNYAAGTQTGPHTPQAVNTLLGNGTDPGNTSRAPGGAATMVDAFSLATSAGTDTVTAVTVSFAAGTAQGVSLVEITNAAGSVVHGSVSNPSDTVAVSLSTPIPVTTSSAEYRIRITPKSHAAMPLPPGGTYAVTAVVGSLTSSQPVLGSDTGSATVTIDNQSTAAPVWGANNPGDGVVDLAWSNPGDGDFVEVLIVRGSAPVSGAPTEGATYNVGNGVGTGSVVYRGGAVAYSDTAVVNGTAYYYAAFAKDTSGNYSVAATTGPLTPSSVAGDTDAPCAPTDLHVFQRTGTSVTIRFTAPFEDCVGGSGNPDRYMIRYGFDLVDDAAWAVAESWNDSWSAVAVAGAQEEITLSGLDSNQRYVIQVKAVDLNNNVSPLAVLQGAGTNVGRTHLHTGWNMAGNENLLGATDTCQGVFGVTACYGWSSTGVGDWDGSYVDTGAAGALTPGKGYWLSVGSPTVDLAPPGDSSPTTGDVVLPLQVGMNLVANPHDVAIPVSALSIVQNGSTTLTYSQAISAGWVLPAVYAYDGTNYAAQPAVGLPEGQLHPRKAVWLKLSMDDGNSYELILPDPTP